MAVTELFCIFKKTLPAIFSILNNVSIRRDICLNFWKFARGNKPSHFWQKFFFLFPADIYVSLRRTQIIWRLHTKLDKFVWNIMSNNLSTEYHTDLRLSQRPYLFIICNVSISWLHSLNGFLMTWQWKPAITLPPLNQWNSKFILTGNIQSQTVNLLGI